MKNVSIRTVFFQTTAYALATYSLFYVNLSDANAQPAIAAPIQNWSYIHHSSTATEGALRGQAEVISAAGTYRYMDSLAIVNYQEAYRRAIENRHARVKRYFEERAIVFEYREKYWPKAFVGEPRRLANERAMPKKLTTRQFNGQKGTLNWPYELKDAKYKVAKDTIDGYFAHANGHERGMGTECEVEVTRLCSAMKTLVFDRSNDFTPDQKIYTSEFLRSVIRECQTPFLIALERDRDEMGAE